MTSGRSLARAAAEKLFVEHEAELRRFLAGVLKDDALAGDVLQAAFVKLLDRGGEVQEGARKAWLFQVAFREAMAVRRRQAVDEKARRQVAWSRSTGEQIRSSPIGELAAAEELSAVRQALERLPERERRIVQMRMYEEKTFAQIAAELGIPLGTALGRMRTALGRLRETLRESQAEES